MSGFIHLLHAFGRAGMLSVQTQPAIFRSQIWKSRMKIMRQFSQRFWNHAINFEMRGFLYVRPNCFVIRGLNGRAICIQFVLPTLTICRPFALIQMFDFMRGQRS